MSAPLDAKWVSITFDFFAGLDAHLERNQEVEANRQHEEDVYHEKKTLEDCLLQDPYPSAAVRKRIANALFTDPKIITKWYKVLKPLYFIATEVVIQVP